MIQTSAAHPPPAMALPEVAEIDWSDPLLRLAGALQHTHALILGKNGLDLMCLLNRNGCPAVAAVGPAGKLEAGAYNLAVVPDASDTSSFDTLIRKIRRALAPGGRLIACVPNGPSTSALIRRLRLNGFALVRCVHLSRTMVLRADLRGLS